MSTKSIALVLALGWSLAAVALWWSGWWYANTNRYDDCEVFDTGTVVFWACPIEVRPQPQPDPGGAA